MNPLQLLEDDYGRNGTAPVSFNVIDTSSLLDHVGGLNLLAATSPLLEGDASSSLYTETLIQRGAHSQQAHIDQLLGGHLATASLLLGLFPIEYWTNTSSSSAGDEELLMAAHLSQLPKAMMAHRKQIFSRITWKRPPSSLGPRMQPLHIKDGELASLLYRIYVHIFPALDVPRMLANFKSGSISRVSLPQYTRPGFVALLRLTKDRVITDWGRAMEGLLALIESNPDNSNPGLLLETASLPEMDVYMHLLDLHSVNTFANFPALHAMMCTGPTQTPALTGWQDMPPSVCITLKVPRSALRELTDADPRLVGSIPVRAEMHSSEPEGVLPWANIFAGVQLCFGNLSVSGSRFSNSFALNVEEDPQGWHGNSPLYVSFRVSSRVLFFEPRTALVRFSLHPTPKSMSMFAQPLGLTLSLFQTTLRDAEHVYVSKHLPNQTGLIVIPGFAKDAFTPKDVPGSGIKTTVTAHVNPETERVASLTIRLDMLSDVLRSALGGGGTVETTSVSPCTYTVTICNTPLTATFPLPILRTTLKTRIARASFYVELSATILPNPATQSSPTFTSPLLFSPSTATSTSPPTPICWTIPHLNLRTLPLLAIPPSNGHGSSIINLLAGHVDVLDTSNLSAKIVSSLIHTRQMFSVREARLRANPSLLAAATPSEKARLALKESLHALFFQSSGVKPSLVNQFHGKRRESAFVLYEVGSEPKRGVGAEAGNGMWNIVIFVSGMRLDLARRTVVLDCAVLVLSREVLKALRADKDGNVFLEEMIIEIGGMGVLKMDGEELRLWKEMMPAWVERCREWTHKEGCEFQRENGEWKAPVSVAMGEEVVCGCGKGVFPKGYDMDEPMWWSVKKHCVRAAISPLFASPLVEDVVPGIWGRECCVEFV